MGRWIFLVAKSTLGIIPRYQFSRANPAVAGLGLHIWGNKVANSLI